MIMPSFTVLPESMFPARDVAQPFNSVTLAGMRGMGSDDWAIDQTIPVEWLSADQAAQNLFSGNANYATNSGSVNQDALNAIIQGGFDVAKLFAIKPGTTQTAQGISQQNPGYPIQTLGVSAKASGGNSTLLILAALGIGAFMLMQKGKTN